MRTRIALLALCCLALPGLAQQELTLPALGPLPLERPLVVVATTSIVGDVVARVGGEAIALTTLMGPGQDPHGYEPAARDLATASRAEVVFVNGWDLEETLLATLEAVAEGVPLVPVSAGIAPLEFGGRGGERGRGADPHTWLSVANVGQWVANIRQVLSALDPANADGYAANAEAYLAELAELEAYAAAAFAALPGERRTLVTNHDALGYFAAAYGFEVIGTVMPGSSTLAEPSASSLAGLIGAMAAAGACTLFAETTVSDRLARTVAAELGACEEVRVVSLYTGALGPAGSGADSYLGMMRANIDAIVAGLR